MRIKENTEKRFKQKKKSKKKFFRMLRNLTKAGRYLCFQRHLRSNLNAYLNIAVKVSFFWKGVQQSGLVIEMMIQKNFKGLEKIEVLITSHPI